MNNAVDLRYIKRQLQAVDLDLGPQWHLELPRNSFLQPGTSRCIGAQCPQSAQPMDPGPWLPFKVTQDPGKHISKVHLSSIVNNMVKAIYTLKYKKLLFSAYKSVS